MQPLMLKQFDLFFFYNWKFAKGQINCHELIFHILELLERIHPKKESANITRQKSGNWGFDSDVLFLPFCAPTRYIIKFR